MIRFAVPDWTDHRITCQLIPDSTGKFATLAGLDDKEFTLPVVGWAVVLEMEDNQLPRLLVEPVVDEECYGPIAVGDLICEEGFLRLVEVQ